MKENLFLENTARDGGAIKWTKLSPIIGSSNYFYNNKAFYGQDLASYAIRMTLRAYKIDESDALYDSQINKEICSMKLVSGGENLYLFKIQLVDSYNQTVLTNEGFKKNIIN